MRVGLYLAGTLGVVLWIAARFDAMAGRQGSPDLGELAVKSLKSLNEAPDSRGQIEGAFPPHPNPLPRGERES